MILQYMGNRQEWNAKIVTKTRVVSKDERRTDIDNYDGMMFTSTVEHVGSRRQAGNESE